MSQLVSNARWLAFAQVLKIVMQLISVTLLARLLAPEYYGLMAMAMTMVNFASLFRDLGTSAAVIQKSDLTEDLKNSVFNLSKLMGIAIGAMVCLIAPIISNFYNQPDLIPVTILIAVTFPISGYTMIHQALAEKEGNFKGLTVVEVGSSFVGLVLAIASAYLGAGVYALVIQNLAYAVISAIGLLRISNWRPTSKTSLAGLSAVFGYSGNLVGFNVISYISRNSDSWIIGRFLGASALGVYAMANRIMVFPLESVTYVSNRALFPVLSKAKDDLSECRALYFKTVQSVALLTFPIMGGIWLVRDEFVLLILGQRWAELIPVIAWLAPVGLIRSINSTTGTVFMALGRTDLQFKLGLFVAVVHVAAYLVGVQGGLEGVAAVYFFANFLNAGPNIFFATRLIGAGYLDVGRAIAPAAFGTGVMVALGVTIRHYFDFAIAFSDFAMLVVIGGGAYVLALVAFFPAQFKQIRSFVRK